MVAHNPAQILLRILNLLVISGCGWAMYLISRDLIIEPQHLTWWHVLYVLPVIAFVGCGSFFVYGLKTPTHTHLSLLVSLGFFVMVGGVLPQAGFLTHYVFVPEVAEPLNGAIYWLLFICALMAAIAVDWKFGKSAGFVPSDKMWWTESHIRGFCVFLAWWTFFGGMSWLPDYPNAPEIYSEHIQEFSSISMFFGLIVFCGAIGGLLPHLLMSLTGITPCPPGPRRRRRGFHLWQSTEPVPPSAPTENQS